MRTPLSILLFLFFLNLRAQPVLKKTIGLDALPSDTERIQTLNPQKWLDSPYTIGIHEGDTIPQFVLYDLNGKSLDIREELKKGKPVFLLAGSYTCEQFRGSAYRYDTLVQRFKNKVSFFIIYGIEAHPKYPEVCPYTEDYWPIEDNFKAKINYSQPKNYGERKKMVTLMLSKIKPKAEVFIDGPKNNWFQAFGPAPNIAYLIAPSGIVYSKFSAFRRAQGEAAKAINSLLSWK